MDNNKLCQHCQKRHAARTHSQEGKDGATWEFYCLDCYNHLFLDEVGANGGESLSSCPYCGMTASAVAKGKLVGCAHCYLSMQATVYPMIHQMQGKKAHKGKFPPLDSEYGDPYDYEDTVGAEYRAKAMAQARYERQCNELETIIEKLMAEERFEEVKSYQEKLRAMRNRCAIEEDFVWRTRRK